MRKIEFNNGFVTALALFYGHKHQFEEAQKSVGHDMRIYAAADHLFDIEYPKDLDPKLKRKIQRFVSDVLAVRLKKITMEKGDKLFDRCCKLLMEIDKKCFGLKVKVEYP